MQTIIKIKTYSCLECNYHQDFEPTPELMRLNHYRSDNICPSCKKQPLVLQTDNAKKAIITVIGEKDIEDEINPEKSRPLKHKMPVNTLEEKEAYRTQRKADITKAIVEARKLEDK